MTYEITVDDATVMTWTDDELSARLKTLARWNGEVSDEERRISDVANTGIRDVVFGADLGGGERARLILNQLKTQILGSEDAHLIELFRRAVRNHDTLHPAHQADPVPTFNKHYRRPDFQTKKKLTALKSNKPTKPQFRPPKTSRIPAMTSTYLIVESSSYTFAYARIAAGAADCYYIIDYQ